MPQKSTKYYFILHITLSLSAILLLEPLKNIKSLSVSLNAHLSTNKAIIFSTQPSSSCDVAQMQCINRCTPSFLRGAAMMYSSHCFFRASRQMKQLLVISHKDGIPRQPKLSAMPVTSPSAVTPRCGFEPGRSPPRPRQHRTGRANKAAAP